MLFSMDEIKRRAIPIAQKYGIARLGLFGSYARGDAHDGSDLDFIIRVGQLRGLVQYFGFVYDLEDTFQCHVDVVTDGIEDKAFLNRIKEDEVILYEAG